MTSLFEEKYRLVVAAEEAEGRDVDVAARIHVVELPPDDVKGVELQAREVYNEYRHLFKSYEEAEYFSMLPLSVKQRSHVLARAVALSERDNEEKRLSSGTLQSESGH